MRTSYLTLKDMGEAQYIEKKSRFIGTAKQVGTESEALAFIASTKERYKYATHNVFAYSVGEGVLIKRYSDDGEPSGTAGLPVLDVIEKSGLSDSAIVVTRYFGGVLLGAAGLIRSYGKAASLCVEAAHIIRLSLAETMLVLVEYPMLGTVRNAIEKRGYGISDIQYGVDAQISVTVPSDETEPFSAALIELTSGTAVIERNGYSYLEGFV